MNIFYKAGLFNVYGSVFLGVTRPASIGAPEEILAPEALVTMFAKNSYAVQSRKYSTCYNKTWLL